MLSWNDCFCVKKISWVELRNSRVTNDTWPLLPAAEISPYFFTGDLPNFTVSYVFFISLSLSLCSVIFKIENTEQRSQLFLVLFSAASSLFFLLIETQVPKTFLFRINSITCFFRDAHHLFDIKLQRTSIFHNKKSSHFASLYWVV